MYHTSIYDAAWERAWTEAGEFGRRRYRALGWREQLAVLCLVAGEDGPELGEAIRRACRYAKGLWSVLRDFICRRHWQE